MGGLANWRDVARRVSPLEYVRAGLPPILTLHRDADEVVPYTHATRLHAALEKAGVPNKLHTIPGGNHGGFNLNENLEAMRVIRAFLEQHGIVGGTAPSEN